MSRASPLKSDPRTPAAPCVLIKVSVAETAVPLGRAEEPRPPGIPRGGPSGMAALCQYRKKHPHALQWTADHHIVHPSELAFGKVDAALEG